jgi:hypothetical protein
MAMKTKSSILFLFVAIFFCHKLIAQPFNLNKKIVPIELKMLAVKPANKPSLAGKMNLSTITQTEDTMYFFVKGAGIYQTTYFGYTGFDDKQKPTIYLCKNNWKKPEKTSDIKQGKWNTTFRTEGSFGIMVVKNSAFCKYDLLTWISPECTDFTMPSPFKSTPQK